MKKTILLICTLLLLSFNSCSQSPTENGIIENGIYKCNLIDWNIKIPENFKVRTLKQKEDLEDVGYEKVKGNTPDGIEVRKNRSDLIGFEIDERNYFSSSFESLEGTKKMSLMEHQKFVDELLSNTYSKINGIEFENSLNTEKIGKYDFYSIETKIYNAKTKELVLTQLIYNSFVGENLFSISINYTDKRVYEILDNNFRNSLTE
ncbi:hypothetical protein [Gelidibacter mesophilus]|uniref:hypothetical protein n=1 Tax=Gelidibacter mesophilus TaxID=169050 RepID=UPI0004851C4E|nr:hypothetical protein [Gelidibacter mesophilus]